jgi:hypothetical protein
VASPWIEVKRWYYGSSSANWNARRHIRHSGTAVKKQLLCTPLTLKLNNQMEKRIEDYFHLYIGADAMVARPNGRNPEKITPAMLAHLHQLGQSWDLYKPILRRLDSMTREEAVEFIHRKHRSIMCNIDRTHITKVSFGETENIINFSYFKYQGAGAEAGSKTYYVNQSDAEQFAWLLSEHFDLFGLIDAGLAIDKSTIK